MSLMMVSSDFCPTRSTRGLALGSYSRLQNEEPKKRCSNIATACAKRVTEAQHRETSPRKAWRPDEGTEMVYARGTLLRRLFMDRIIQSDFDTWCSSPIAWQLRVQVDQCWTLEECDGCRVYRSPRSRVLAKSTGKPGLSQQRGLRALEIDVDLSSHVRGKHERRRGSGARGPPRRSFAQLKPACRA